MYSASTIELVKVPIATVRLTADSYSVGIVVACMSAWIVNLIDLTLFDPIRFILPRAILGMEPLPMDIWYDFKVGLTAFVRWWLVLTVAVSCVIYVSMVVRNKLRPKGSIYKLPILIAAFLMFVVGRLYFVPISMRGFAFWSVNMALTLIATLMFCFASVTSVRWVMLRFSEGGVK